MRVRKQQNLKAPIVSFILLTNIIFIPLFLLTGITVLLGFPTVVFDIMLIIASWSSTFAFLILFKRIYPEKSIVSYIKSKFSNKMNWVIVGLIILIQTLIVIGIIYRVESKNNINGSLFTISSIGMLVYYFFKTLLAGPLGEELGWRGFALQELQKKYSPLKSAFIVGFWWGIWHMPIWFTTGFIGKDLLVYSVYFMISIIAVSIMMTVFYNLNKNLMIPMMIHFLFNFFIGLINGNILVILGYYALFYGVVVAVLMVINPGQSLYMKKDKVDIKS